jgi:hypothetical protein
MTSKLAASTSAGHRFGATEMPRKALIHPFGFDFAF